MRVYVDLGKGVGIQMRRKLLCVVLYLGVEFGADFFAVHLHQIQLDLRKLNIKLLKQLLHRVTHRTRTFRKHKYPVRRYFFVEVGGEGDEGVQDAFAAKTSFLRHTGRQPE